MWLRVVVERRLPRPQLPLPFSRGFSERQDGRVWATRHKTQPGVYPFVTCMMSRWVGWLAVTELGTSAKRANRRYMRAMG